MPGRRPPALAIGQPGYLGLAVYEYEKGLFVNDHSQQPLHDDGLRQLLACSSVLIIKLLSRF